MRIHIRRISPSSLSIVIGAIYGIVGILVGVLGVCGALVSFGIGSAGQRGVFEAFQMLVIQPLMSAVIGVITGFLIAWMYNFVARFTKGILIEYSEAGRHDD